MRYFHFKGTFELKKFKIISFNLLLIIEIMNKIAKNV